jgi:FMN reductase
LKPFIVGIGGTLRSASSSEAALRTALATAENDGAETLCLSATELNLPLYEPFDSPRSPTQQALVDAFRRANGLILSSPGYHGGVSGLIKNALDYAEDTADDDRVYISDIPVGCIAVAYGSQAAVSTLANLRTIVHALRGIPTPYGAAIVAGPRMFEQGRCVDSDTCARLATVGHQVVDLAYRLSQPIHPFEGQEWSRTQAYARL